MDPWSRQQFEDQKAGILGLTTNYTQGNAPTTASMTPDMIRARELANSNVGNWQGILGGAEAAATAGGEGILGPDPVAYRTYNAGDEAKFFNPFQQNVIDSTSALYDENLAKSINQQNDAVAMRGAFGNVSRDLGEAELRRGAALDKANMIANLKYSGFNDAMGRTLDENGNVYRADVRNSDAAYGARQFNQQQKLASAGILGQLAGQKQQLGQNDVAMLESLGATAREIEQAKITGDLNKLLLELQTRQGILGATPMGQTTTSSGSGTSSGTSRGSNFGLSFSYGPKGFSIGG